MIATGWSSVGRGPGNLQEQLQHSLAQPVCLRQKTREHSFDFDNKQTNKQRTKQDEPGARPTPERWEKLTTLCVNMKPPKIQYLTIHQAHVNTL